MSKEIERKTEGGLELMASLERLGAATETSLDLPADISYDRYEAVGLALATAYRGMIWMIADWINFGELTFKEKFAQAVEVTKLHPETLDNYARIARKVPAERRLAGVPMGIHAEVASLEPEQQTEWLTRARDLGWRREDLRVELRPLKNLDPLPEPVADHARVETAARDMISGAKEYGADFLVHGQAFRQLRAALGYDA